MVTVCGSTSTDIPVFNSKTIWAQLSFKSLILVNMNLIGRILYFSTDVAKNRHSDRDVHDTTNGFEVQSMLNRVLRYQPLHRSNGHEIGTPMTFYLFRPIAHMKSSVNSENIITWH